MRAACDDYADAFVRLAPPLRDYCLRRTGCSLCADHVVERAFVALARVGDVQLDARVSALRLVLRELRADAGHRSPVGATPEVADLVLRLRLARAPLAGLRLGDVEPLTLRDWTEMPVRDTAAALAISPARLEARLADAQRRLERAPLAGLLVDGGLPAPPLDALTLSARSWNARRSALLSILERDVAPRIRRHHVMPACGRVASA